MGTALLWQDWAQEHNFVERKQVWNVLEEDSVQVIQSVVNISGHPEVDKGS